MPPRRLRRGAVERLVTNWVAEAIAKYERNRANPEGTEGARGDRAGNAGGDIAPEARGCTYKVFLGCNPLSINGTEGAVGLSRALTWWNGYVYSLGIDAANQIPWAEFKHMMTDEYCPRNELQRMKQELWNLTVKGDDIEGYTNRFYELAALCTSMVTPEYKKIERYVWGLLEIIPGNVTSSKPATAHKAIRMAHILMDQAVRFKAVRSGEANKRKWEDHQSGGNNYNNNHINTHHHQQNQRQEVAKAFVAALAEGKGYRGNRPQCNRCNLHHSGQCPPKCRKCQRTGHLERDCWNKTPAADSPPTADANT
ncbi:putative reverse transcriptase domain-containing protein [Tanacetum coccineum]